HGMPSPVTPNPRLQLPWTTKAERAVCVRQDRASRDLDPSTAIAERYCPDPWLALVVEGALRFKPPSEYLLAVRFRRDGGELGGSRIVMRGSRPAHPSKTLNRFHCDGLPGQARQ